jgi:hypothetical protein
VGKTKCFFLGAYRLPERSFFSALLLAALFNPKSCGHQKLAASMPF